MKRIKDTIQTITVSVIAAVAVVMLGFAPAPPALHAQSTKVGGRDVVSTPESWFQRLGLLNGNGGCDIAIEYDSLNVARVTDCTAAANLKDVKLRNLFSSGTMLLGGTATGGALTDYFLTKEVTGLVDNTFTDVLTVTVPNAAESATIPLIINSRLGAGGTIGADECTGTAYGQVVVSRTAGVNAVATATTLADTGSACVAGATTIATAYQVSSISGAVGAVNTFTIQIRVTKGAGSSAAHKVDVQADVLNANASGVTIS